MSIKKTKTADGGLTVKFGHVNFAHAAVKQVIERCKLLDFDRLVYETALQIRRHTGHELAIAKAWARRIVLSAIAQLVGLQADKRSLDVSEAKRCLRSLKLTGELRATTSVAA